MEVRLQSSLSLLLVGRVKRARHEYDLRVIEGARRDRARDEPSFLASTMFARARCTLLTKSKEKEGQHSLTSVERPLDTLWKLHKVD